MIKLIFSIVAIAFCSLQSFSQEELLNIEDFNFKSFRNSFVDKNTLDIYVNDTLIGKAFILYKYKDDNDRFHYIVASHCHEINIYDYQNNHNKISFEGEEMKISNVFTEEYELNPYEGNCGLEEGCEGNDCSDLFLWDIIYYNIDIELQFASSSNKIKRGDIIYFMNKPSPKEKLLRLQNEMGFFYYSQKSYKKFVDGNSGSVLFNESGVVGIHLGCESSECWGLGINYIKEVLKEYCESEGVTDLYDITKPDMRPYNTTLSKKNFLKYSQNFDLKIFLIDRNKKNCTVRFSTENRGLQIYHRLDGDIKDKSKEIRLGEPFEFVVNGERFIFTYRNPSTIFYKKMIPKPKRRIGLYKSIDYTLLYYQ